MKLEIRGLSKSYGKKPAIKDINLELDPGIYGLLGPNGAGKSTLMNLITGNLREDGGRILYNGRDIRPLGKSFREILGYMPQQQGLYDHFTGYQFLSYIAALKGMSKAKAGREIESVLSLVNLADERYKRLGAYSGGMKQRILVAQAILNHPEVLILDEPTAGLDPKERIKVRNIVSEIAQDRIVILATHIVLDVEQIAKEIILIKKGSIIGQGSPHAFLSSLQDSVYEMEIAPGELEEVERRYLVSTIMNRADRLVVHAVCDSEPRQYRFCKAAPSLEDVYLYSFADEVR